MKNNKIILLGADHNGIALKDHVKDFLRQAGFLAIDLGPFENITSVDYVDYANQLAQIIHRGDVDSGILICGTGVGMSIVANKVDGIRAVLAHNFNTAIKSREHNDSNVLCLGAWINDAESNLEIVGGWLEQKFGEYRHVRRLSKIDQNPLGKLVFTNGVFDILHSGHIELLKFSKRLGDKLVVGLNSDASVRKLKGPDRPVNSELDRKAVLESIKYVDEVIIFDEQQSTNLVKTLRPSIVVKGGEWTADEVRVRDAIPDDVDVKVCPLVQGYSSTKIISNIKG
jgi:rfaE bifunctional protein nucleotidyltransferase chain/domain